MYVKSINEVGRAEIKMFLSARHRLSGEHFTPEMIKAWSAKAEFQLAEGNAACIEIPAHDCVSGFAEEFTVSDAGIDLHPVIE